MKRPRLRSLQMLWSAGALQYYEPNPSKLGQVCRASSRHHPQYRQKYQLEYMPKNKINVLTVGPVWMLRDWIGRHKGCSARLARRERAWHLEIRCCCTSQLHVYFHSHEHCLRSTYSLCS